MVYTRSFMNSTFIKILIFALIINSYALFSDSIYMCGLKSDNSGFVSDTVIRISPEFIELFQKLHPDESSSFLNYNLYHIEIPHEDIEIAVAITHRLLLQKANLQSFLRDRLFLHGRYELSLIVSIYKLVWVFKLSALINVCAALIAEHIECYIEKNPEGMRYALVDDYKLSKELLLRIGCYILNSNPRLHFSFCKILKGHKKCVNSVAFSPDGSQIVTASNDKTIKTWDVTTGELLQEFHGHTDWVRTAVFAHKGQHIFSASWDKSVIKWDARTGNKSQVFKKEIGSVNSATLSPNDQKLVLASADNTIRIWDSYTGLQQAMFCGHTDAVKSAIYSPIGLQVISASNDKTVRIWNIITNEQLLLLEGHSRRVNSAVYSPNCLYIVSASADTTVRIWSDNGKELRILEGHTKRVNSAVFSPNSQYIVSASADKTIRIWDVETGEQIQILEGHTRSVTSAVFSPDGTQIASTSWDKTVRIWYTPKNWQEIPEDVTFEDILNLYVGNWS